MSVILFPDLSYKVTGIFFEVHNKLGRYCNEQQYADSIESGLKNRQIKYEREKLLPVSFEGEQEGRNKVDFLIENKIIVEIKAKRMILKEDYYQIRRYLNAFNIRLGILVNFHDLRLKPKRILNSQA